MYNGENKSVTRQERNTNVICFILTKLINRYNIYTIKCLKKLDTMWKDLQNNKQNVTNQQPSMYEELTQIVDVLTFFSLSQLFY
jgi:hypothetical protein